MRAVVCGAGIGGLAVARVLCADGWDVTVLERDDGPTGGAAVTLFANGYAALAPLGIDGGATDLGGEIAEMEFRGADGSRISRLDLGVIARRTGHGTRTVPRRDLLARLAAGLPDGAVRHGCPAVTVAPDGRSVVDATGETHRPDLLVGADGHRSVVRAATVDPAPARDVGWCTWQGLDPVLPGLAEAATGLCVVGDAGLVGLMPAGNGLVQWWFDTRTDAGATFDDVRAAFADYADPVPALLAAVDGADRFTHRVHTVPDRWGTGPATLVGDAAHVFPPSQAQGANQALEDAWVLTRCLRDSSDRQDVDNAVRRYEAERAPKVRRISALAASEVTNRPPSRAVRLAARLAPPTVAARAWLGSVRRSSSVLAGPFATS